MPTMGGGRRLLLVLGLLAGFAVQLHATPASVYELGPVGASYDPAAATATPPLSSDRSRWQNRVAPSTAHKMRFGLRKGVRRAVRRLRGKPKPPPRPLGQAPAAAPFLEKRFLHELYNYKPVPTTLYDALKGVTNFPQLFPIPLLGTVGWIQKAVDAAQALQLNNDVLTVEEQAAIYLYTAGEGFYLTFNKAFYEQDVKKIQEFMPYAAFLMHIFSKLPPFKGTVYRGLAPPKSAQMVSEFASKQGKPDTEQNYVVMWNAQSTSRKRGVAEGFAGGTNPNYENILLVMHIFNGVDIDKYSMYQKKEKEVLLAPAQCFFVVSVKTQNIKKTPVHVVELDQRQCTGRPQQQQQQQQQQQGGPRRSQQV